MSIRAFIDNDLNGTELAQLANPPLPLFLSIEDLLKLPSAKNSINPFLIYRRNYSASFPLDDKKPNFKTISKEASAKWRTEGMEVRTFFILLADIMKRRYEQSGKHSPQHIAVLVHAACIHSQTVNFT